MKTLAVILLATMVHAKRAAPPKVEPVNSNGVTYSFATKRSAKGYQEFIMAKIGENVGWQTELFQVIYDEKMERDVQDVHPKSLTLKKDVLVITDEKGITYEVKATTGELKTPLKSVIYSRK